MPPRARQPGWNGQASCEGATTSKYIYRWLSAFLCIDVVSRRRKGDGHRVLVPSRHPGRQKGIVARGVANTYHRAGAKPVHSGHFYPPGT
jgi:hypothetical protein